MTQNWIEFLEDEGLVLHQDGFSRSRSETVDAFQKLSGDTICDLTHTAQVDAEGNDAGDFLQNQLTNDVGSLGPEQSIPAGYCNPKGRLICTFRTWRSDRGFVLQHPASLHQASTERLRKYVLRAKVDLSTDERKTAFGICGKTVAKGLEQLTGRLPKRDNELLWHEKLAVIRVPGDGRPRYQISGPENACTSVWQKLRRHAHVVGSWTWARMDILAGIPNIAPATTELFIPQMVNLDRIGGVNFRKGCYPGQEIVARMHYLGNLKQRMARFRVDDEHRPVPGDRVYTQGGTAPTGTVVDAQPGAGSGWDLLAVVRIADLDHHTLHLNHDRGARLFRQELPYSILDPEQAESGS